MLGWNGEAIHFFSGQRCFMADQPTPSPPLQKAINGNPMGFISPWSFSAIFYVTGVRWAGGGLALEERLSTFERHTWCLDGLGMVWDGEASEDSIQNTTPPIFSQRTENAKTPGKGDSLLESHSFLGGLAFSFRGVWTAKRFEFCVLFCP